KKYQTSRESISDALSGFAAESGSGISMYTGKAWDYPGLCRLYQSGVEKMRADHRPALFHIQEVTQQLGHSTSGDHRRYKSPERLEFEEKFDCNRRMAEWMLESGIATPEEVEQIKADAKKEAAAAALRAYRHYHDKVAETRRMVDSLLGKLTADFPDVAEL
ncbi:MAG: thiamine pyrophosphate-dependent enzyme, partial [Bacteroidota bacterium]